MRGYRIPSLSQTLGHWLEIRNVRPPARTLDDLERYLREIAPYVTIDGDGRPTFFAVNIHRWKIRLEDARREGLTYEQAEQLWEAVAEREQAATQEAQDYGARTAARALDERNNPRRGGRSKQRYGADTEPADELFEHANEVFA